MEAANRADSRGLLHCAGDYLRWLLVLLLITSSIGLAGLYLLQTRLDDEIRRHLESKFQDHYADLLVKIKSARRLPRGGIEVRGLSIAAPTEGGTAILLAQVDELLVDCDTRLSELLSDRAGARQLIVRRLLLRPTRYSDGSWSTSRLLPLPKFGRTPPAAKIESGRIEFCDASGQQPEYWTVDNVELHVDPRRDRERPAAKGGGGAPSLLRVAELVTSFGPAGPAESRRPPADNSMPVFAVRGRLANDILGSVECRGQVDFSNNRWDLAGTVQQLPVSAGAIDALPRYWAGKLSLLRALRGTAAFEYRFSRDSQQPPAFEVVGEFRGEIDDVRLPRAIREVQIPFRCDERSLVVERATGRLGQSLLVASCKRFGWDPTSALRCSLRAEQFVFDQSLRTAVRGAWQEHWDRFAPEGIVDADVTLTFDGRQWQHEIDVLCRGCSFAYEQFPYRLTDTQGHIYCDSRELRIENLQALAAGRPVRISGTLQNPGAEATGWIEAHGEQPIPIDERLITALRTNGPHNQPGPREIVRSLHPHGHLTFFWRSGRDSVDHAPSRHLQIGLHDCAVRYDKFLYRIYGIHGRLTMQDDRWQIVDLRGRHGSGSIGCLGNWQPDGLGGCRVALDFHAGDVPLDDELRDALHEGPRQVWKQLRPRGTIDELHVAVRFQSAPRQLDVGVTARKAAGIPDAGGRSITVIPRWFPYQLDQVTGQFEFSQGQITLREVQARHGPTRIRLAGWVDRPAPDTWQLRLSELHADGVRMTHDLVAALPAPLQRAASKLDVEGPLNLSGSIALGGTRGEPTVRTSEWDVDLDLENGSVHCGTRFDHIHGGVHLKGGHGPQGMTGHGLLEVDSVVFQGVQLTSVRGPMSIDQNRLAFGRWTLPRGPHDRPPAVSARGLGGTISTSAVVGFGDTGFKLEARLHSGDLSVISREATARRHDISGDAFGSIQLSGSSHGVHTLRGQGQLQLREADIYKLPVLARLLKLLRIRPPDETAFTSSDLDYRVVGDHIYFDHIDFQGDAISLEGQGEMDFQRKLNLTFAASVGRDDDQPIWMLVRPILKEAGRHLMSIRVTGTLQDPQTEPIALPDVNEGFQQVFPETPLGG